MPRDNFFKLLSVFLFGLIIGFLISKVNLASLGGQAVPQITEEGSIKVIGNQNAKVTVTEYSDFQCPLCHSFFVDSLPTILKSYVDTGKVKFIYKHFPLNIHPQAPAAALASECALEQGKFWEMHDLLFERQAQWSGQPSHLDMFKQMAAELNLNTDQFATCLDTKKLQKNVDIDYNESIAKNFRGTPMFLINDQMIVGAQDVKTFTDAIDAELAK